MTTTAEPRPDTAGPVLLSPVEAAARARLARQSTGAPEPDERLDIAAMADRTGVTAHTLRYYERIGLLEVERDAAGHRSYTAADFGRVVFLSRLRMTGMPVRDLKRYVDLVVAGETTEPDRMEMLRAHRDRVRAQLAELTFALETIELKIQVYGGSCGG